MINGHGDDIYNQKTEIRANFSSNIYSDINHSNITDYIAKNLNYIKSYPEPTPVSTETMLSLSLNISQFETCVTNGATEAIYLIAQMTRGKHSEIIQPTFSEYNDACQIHNHKVRHIFGLDDISDNAEVVWLCNPNNPTGLVFEKEKLIETIKQHSNKTFVIDQSYEHFTEKAVLSPKECIEKLPNTIIINSMTKKYAIPGLRIGYIISSETTISKIKQIRMPWSVNAIAILTANHILTNKESIKPIEMGFLKQETRHFIEQIKSLELFDFYDNINNTDTHYMLLRLRKGTAAELKSYLINNHGILIRDASNFVGLDDRYIRIATQERSKNNMLISALREFQNSYILKTK